MITELVYISRRLGSVLEYAQGGGGNTSYKLDKEKMAVKASGTSLKEMTLDRGYTVVRYREVAESLAAVADEKTFETVISSCAIDNGQAKPNRPSIETGLHAILNRAVIHTHSLFINLLACSLEGEQLTKELFPSALYIPYENPGLALFHAVRKALNGFKTAPPIIILQNHGVFITAESMSEAFLAHEELNLKVLKRFNNLYPFFSVPEVRREDFFSGILFPDQAVYLSSNSDTQAARETKAACKFLIDNMERLRLTPRFIPDDKTALLLKLESEKYRLKTSGL